jgi:predicted transcriptional regulator
MVKPKPVCFRLTAEDYEALQRVAKSEDLRQQDVMRRALRAYVAEREGAARKATASTRPRSK